MPSTRKRHDQPNARRRSDVSTHERAVGRRRAAVTAALLTGVAGSAHGAARHHRQAGGTITVLSAGDVDHIDPGQAYYSFTYEISYATQRPLLSYRPNSINAIPDLASAMPRYSNGGKTVTVHIRPGVRFSPPSTAR